MSPFLFKTWNLVSDPTTDHIVNWAPDGLTFVVHKPDAMVRASHCLCLCAQRTTRRPHRARASGTARHRVRDVNAPLARVLCREATAASRLCAVSWLEQTVEPPSGRAPLVHVPDAPPTRAGARDSAARVQALQLCLLRTARSLSLPTPGWRSSLSSLFAVPRTSTRLASDTTLTAHLHPFPYHRQLNNYGFRKCHTDRYEFGVPGVQRGNPELLKSLKRHDAQRGTNMKKSSGSGGGAVQRPASARVGNVEGLSGLASTQTASPPPVHVMELGVYGGMQSEVDQLKRDRLLLLQEVMRLREAQTTTTTEVRHLQQRLQQAETVQAQVLTFLQQHISPTLLQANSHYLMPGRKRRHLLMPPSPGRDGDVATAGTADGIMAEPPGSAAQSLELLELPNDPLATELVNGDGEGVDSILGDAHGSYLNRGANSLALSLAPPASTLYGSTTGVFMVSQPSPATPPSLESLELSDALYSAQQSMLPPAQPSDLAFPLSFSQPPSPTPLSRMASGDIETILKEISLDPTEQLPTMEPIKV